MSSCPLHLPSYFTKNCPACGLPLRCQQRVWLNPEFLTKRKWFERFPISNDVTVVITYLQNCEIGPWLMNTDRLICYAEWSTFSVCCLKHWSAPGAEWAKNMVSRSGAVSGCEKKLSGAELERQREVAKRGTKQEPGLTKIDWSDERKFCRSHSAHMLCLSSVTQFPSGGGEGLFRKLIKPLTCKVQEVISNNPAWNALRPVMQWLYGTVIMPMHICQTIFHQIHPHGVNAAS